MCLRLRILISLCVYHYLEHYSLSFNLTYLDIGLQSILNLKTDTTEAASGPEEMNPCVKRTSLEADCQRTHQTANPGKSRE